MMWFVRFVPNSTAAAQWAVQHQLRLFVAEDGSEACTYLADDQLARAAPGGLAVRLQTLSSHTGPAAGTQAAWHYTVATDVVPEYEADFNAWYEQEHLPGLARVPGVGGAARYEVLEGAGPKYHAAYELVERAAFNSPPWLAVRGTAWSSRVRPHFVNTRRVLYQCVGLGR